MIVGIVLGAIGTLIAIFALKCLRMGNMEDRPEESAQAGAPHTGSTNNPTSIATVSEGRQKPLPLPPS